ncbi:hypothetical protein GIB67_015004 [Kingdonia uniflora]|uniref:Uncharacterized protein n=1 Tax=Kingdonia uniflora TaxID=39325 RepID=A0A7J7MTV0_9MAGN|nr:hypothetical protein GIB67_015004 [Kingdonia uniflora]
MSKRQVWGYLMSAYLRWIFKTKFLKQVKISLAVHSTKSQRYNIFGFNIEEIYTQIFFENKIKEDITSKILKNILY